MTLFQPYQTTDAREWAREFLHVYETEDVALDEELMTVWFANAIETGREAGSRPS